MRQALHALASGRICQRRGLDPRRSPELSRPSVTRSLRRLDWNERKAPARAWRQEPSIVGAAPGQLSRDPSDFAGMSIR